MTWSDPVASSACDRRELRKRHCSTDYTCCVLQHARNSTGYPHTAQWRGKQKSE